MNSSTNENELGVIIDGSETAAQFQPPSAWTAETYVVEPLTFEVHAPPKDYNKPTTRASTGPATAILTFPDIGQGEASFSSFFQACRQENACPQVDHANAHYHTHFPGHATDSPNLPRTTDVSMGELVRAVLTFMTRLSIERLIGFGVGLGAQVLLRAAVIQPQKITGLMLISPVIAPCSQLERFGITAERFFTYQLGLGLTRRLKDRFLIRWLSDHSRAQTFGAVISVEEDLDRRNCNNVLRLLVEDIWRGDCASLIAQLKCRVLLITGKASSLHFHVSDYFSEFDAERCSWLDVPEVGSLVQEEAPDRVTTSLSLFLQGIPGFI